jgi:hypothetical protein
MATGPFKGNNESSKREKIEIPGQESNLRPSEHESDALSITPSIHSYKSTQLWYIQCDSSIFEKVFIWFLGQPVQWFGRNQICLKLKLGALQA